MPEGEKGNNLESGKEGQEEDGGDKALEEIMLAIDYDGEIEGWLGEE